MSFIWEYFDETESEKARQDRSGKLRGIRHSQIMGPHLRVSWITMLFCLKAWRSLPSSLLPPLLWTDLTRSMHEAIISWCSHITWEAYQLTVKIQTAYSLLMVHFVGPIWVVQCAWNIFSFTFSTFTFVKCIKDNNKMKFLMFLL